MTGMGAKPRSSNVLAFERQGHGAPVVFVHGYISDLRVWENVRSHWAHPGELLLPTLKGFGKPNVAPNPDEFGTPEHLEQLAGFIELEVGGPAHVVGWSYGATLALLLAASRPELVLSVYAYEAGLSDFISDEAIASQIAKDRADMAAGAVAALAAGDLDQAVGQIVDGACARDGVFATLDAPARRIFLDNAATVPAMFSGEGASSSRGLTGSVLTIQQPVTMSAGEHARPAYRLVADEAARLLPSARRTTLAYGLHVAPVTTPTAFVADVAAHLQPAAQEEW